MDSLGFFFASGLLYLDPFTTFNPKLLSQFNHLIQIYQLTNLFQILLCSKKKFSTLYGGTYLLHSFDHSTTTPWLSFCLAPFFLSLCCSSYRDVSVPSLFLFPGAIKIWNSIFYTRKEREEVTCDVLPSGGITYI